jgi:myo-inositol-1(or 4)-monophosphatase
MSPAMPVPAHAALLGQIVDAAREAADFIREQSVDRAALTWDVKGASDFVSRVDRGAEERIRARLAPPGSAAVFIGEESAPDATIGAGVTFVVDPLDGTTNFLHGFPNYAVSIAALEAGELVAAVVLDVTRDECFTALHGSGTQLNGAPVHVSSIADPSRSLIGTGVPFRDATQIERYLTQLPRVLATTSGIRRAGSAALDLAQVAAGRFDAFWELRLNAWDVAAGMLLVREAGGIVTDLDGHTATVTAGGFVAGNASMHEWLLATIRDRA